MSRKQSENLKGIAILMVLIGHGFRWLTPCPWQLLTWAGAIGVAIFLFLSGYGLMESYMVNGISPVKWWSKRIKKVMIPFWLMMILQTIALWKLGVVFTFKEWVVPFLGYVDYDSSITIDSTMWYITFLMLQYLIFFIIFMVPVPDIMKIIVMCVVYALGYHYQIALVSDWNINYFTFLLGIIVSYISKKKSINMDVIGLMAIVVLLGISTGYFNTRLPNTLVWQLYACSGLVSCLYITKYSFQYEGIINKFCQMMGTYSYFIYLIEGFVVIRLRYIYFICEDYFNLIYYFVFSIALGMAYKKFYDYMCKKGRCIFEKREGETNK